MIEKGWDVVVTHGNGPQVGFILRRSELSATSCTMCRSTCRCRHPGRHRVMTSRALYNEFRLRGIQRAVTVVTQVLVDANDPGFKNPTKPIGGFMDEHTAAEPPRKAGTCSRTPVAAGAGWSPRRCPKIIERDAIKSLIDDGFTVIAVGGGGIPVVENEQHELVGVAAVIDKDHASALLAAEIGADMLMISTAVEKVALNYNKPNQQWLDG